MQSYRFLRAVMNTAVRDGAVMKNPCQIAGAGSDRAKERPVASPAEVVTLLEAITPRYRAAVLLAAWCGLRRGEIIGLRLEDVNVGSATVTVRRPRPRQPARDVSSSLWAQGESVPKRPRPARLAALRGLRSTHDAAREQA
jgi:integrase